MPLHREPAKTETLTKWVQIDQGSFLYSHVYPKAGKTGYGTANINKLVFNLMTLLTSPY